MKTRIEVTHIVDGTVRLDVIEIDAGPGRVNAKIQRRGRGYVKVPGHIVLYRKIEYIEILEVADGDPEVTE